MEICKQPNSTTKLGDNTNTVDIWSAQCGNCFKWRLIPSEEEYEEIRYKLNEDPFFCSKIQGISCDVAAEIEMDNSRIWVIEKPNTPKTPEGFKRRLVIRKYFSKMDLYYDTPNGKRLRAKTEVPEFLKKYPECTKGVSVEDFSFVRPKLMKDNLPANRKYDYEVLITSMWFWCLFISAILSLFVGFYFNMYGGDAGRNVNKTNNLLNFR